MKRTFALVLSFIFCIQLQSKSEDLIPPDTATKVNLTPRESKLIRSLVLQDTSFAQTRMNLNLELYKFDANLLYKYRLDSIETEIPLDHNSYVQSFIDVFVNQRKGQISKMLSLGDYYFPIFEGALAAYKIPLEFKYLPIIESSLDPHAVSRSGATGLWQFMFTTARGYGLSINNYEDERKDPINASYAAAIYLKDAYNLLGDWLLALASYNCGMGAVSRAVAKAGGVKDFWVVQQYLPKETRDYVPKFIAVTYMMNYFDKYPDIKVPDINDKIHIDSIYVNKFISFDKLSSVLEMDKKELEILNPSYKRGIVNGTSSTPKRLIIPKVDHPTYTALFDVLNTDQTGDHQSVYAMQAPQKEKVVSKSNYHTVKKGENISLIANRYNVEVQDIKAWNKLKSSNIVPGQKILVNSKQKSSNVKSSVPSYITYTVKVGDTLSGIAKKFNGVSVASLKDLNKLNSYKIAVGMILKINAN